MSDERTEQVMTRMAPSEVEMLEQIAQADGLYRTDVIRLLIRREHAKRFGSQPGGGKRKRSTEK